MDSIVEGRLEHEGIAKTSSTHRSDLRRADLSMAVLSLAGCKSLGVDARDGPAQTAQPYLGQPLVDLESRLGQRNGSRLRPTKHSQRGSSIGTAQVL